jgi:HipA N-terminal domain
MWNSIIGDKGPSWEQWAQYFVTEHPEVLGDIDLVERFNNPYRAGASSSRAGIVFLTKESGENVPVGIMVYHGDDTGHFVYHKDYLKSDGLPLSGRIPKRAEPIEILPKPGMESEPNALPFISNRGAEGWKSHLEALSIGQITPGYLEDIEREENSSDARRLRQPKEQLERLLTFGRDVPGAFWMLDIDLDPQVEKSHIETLRNAAVAGRSTLAGAQPKILGVKTKHDHYYPARFDEESRTAQLSTHIFKIGTHGIFQW